MMYDLSAPDDPVIAKARAALLGGDDEAIARALIRLAIHIEHPLELACGDLCCASPVRVQSSQSYAGCRCSHVDVAVMHARLAVATILSPAGQREIRGLER